MSRQYETRPDTKLPEWAVIEVIESWWPFNIEDPAKQRLRSAITARYDVERQKEREHASHGI